MTADVQARIERVMAEIEAGLRQARREQLVHGHDWDVADAMPVIRAHVAAVLTGELADRPESVSTTVTEWGVRYDNGLVSGARPTRWENEQEVDRVALGAASPKPTVAANYGRLHPAQVVTRQRTTFADHVTDWEVAE